MLEPSCEPVRDHRADAFQAVDHLSVHQNDPSRLAFLLVAGVNLIERPAAHVKPVGSGPSVPWRACWSATRHSVLAAASVLAFTALLAGLVSLDVAVVVALLVALEAARYHDIPAGRLAVAVAITANATSFLLPTCNITSLLLLARNPVSPLAYLRGLWLGWLLVMAVTVGQLTRWLAPAGSGPARTAGTRPSGHAALDLIPMFAGATAIRAILAGGTTLRSGLAGQITAGTALACAVNNLPAAAALCPDGTTRAVGSQPGHRHRPRLLLTGSVATVICRRIARDSGATLSARQFTAIGLVLAPASLPPPSSASTSPERWANHVRP